MIGKLAIKQLTASDLTLFEWHFKNRNAGNQKAINLNAAIFIDELYPGVPELAAKNAGRIPLDLFLYGPGLEPEYNLQRKIVKFGTYKNWRLDGEFIFNPDTSPERFNKLEPGDFVMLEFSGEGVPISARAVFVAEAVDADKALHAALRKVLGTQAMITLPPSTLAAIVDGAKPPAGHPARQLVVDAALEDVALGGAAGGKTLRQSGRNMSRADLQKAKEAADQCGRQGEEFLNEYLLGLQKAGQISAFEWVADRNVISPFDFRVEKIQKSTFLEVKSTTGEFKRPVHVSLAELSCMAEEVDDCHLYRVYSIREDAISSPPARASPPFLPQLQPRAHVRAHVRPASIPSLEQ